MNTSAQAPASPRPAHAFTLVEVLVSLALCGILFAGTLSTYLYSLNTLSLDLGRSLVNGDYRRLNSLLTDDAAFANQVLVYSEFNDRTIHADSNGDQSGNLVLFVEQTLQPSGSSNITRITGYYRGLTAVAGAPGTALRRFEVVTNVASTTDPLTLIPAASTAGSAAHRVVSPDVVGLNPGAKVFRNYRNAGTGVLLHAQLSSQGNLRRRALNVMQFTVNRRS